jgi:hypothetical protein
MNEMAIIEKPDLQGRRFSFALVEDRVAHYPEFRAFFVRAFDLGNKRLTEPGFIRAPSGIAYALVFIGGNGESCRVSRSMPSLMRSNRSTGLSWVATFGQSCAG